MVSIDCAANGVAKAPKAAPTAMMAVVAGAKAEAEAEAEAEKAGPR